MPRPRPPYLHRETTRHGKTVWYFRRGDGPRVRIAHAFGTREFNEAYLAALAGEKGGATAKERPSGAAARLPRQQIAVRSARPEDEPDVVELWRACGLVASYNDPAADFRFARGGASSDVLIGEDEAGRICGSVMVGHDGHRGWLYYVASAPNLRGRGIGRRMAQAAEDWLRRRGVVKVQILVREANASVVAFYERLGFDLTPRVVMGKWLCKPPEAADGDEGAPPDDEKPLVIW